MLSDYQQHGAHTAAQTGMLSLNRATGFDQEGFLKESEAWSPRLAEQMAEKEGVLLTTDHWTVIDFLRRFYLQYGIAPGLSLLQRALCKEMNDCRWSRKYLRQLFHVRGVSDACRYAGLPKPLIEGCG